MNIFWFLRKVGRFSMCILPLLCFLILWSCSEPNELEKRGFITPKGPVAYDTDAAWSPDGSKIIYARVSSVTDEWEGGLYLYDVASGEDSLIWDNWRACNLTWSPDREWIAFSYNAQIWVMKLNGDSLRQLTTWGENFRSKWSPNGSRIAYDVNGDGLWFCDPDGENKQRVYEHAGSISWFQDGLHMAGLGLGEEIYVIDTLGQMYSKITNTGPRKRRLAVSPDGKEIVFTKDLQLWIVNVDGSNLKQLTTKGGDWPDWSPDGEWIVFTYMGDKNGHLWLMRPDGTERQQITFF